VTGGEGNAFEEAAVGGFARDDHFIGFESFSFDVEAEVAFGFRFIVALDAALFEEWLDTFSEVNLVVRASQEGGGSKGWDENGNLHKQLIPVMGLNVSGGGEGWQVCETTVSFGGSGL
jgi:hypothetical protein